MPNRFHLVALLIVSQSALLISCARHQPSLPEGPVTVEVAIEQNMEIVRQSIYGEPPQFAIWLEDPESGDLRTVFVTYRTATGDWVGKPRVPASLPMWVQVFKHETGLDTLPEEDHKAPDAVTGATPQVEHFKTSFEVPAGSRRIVWIEMNISGDFNEAHKHHDYEKKFIDSYLSGQPPLIYRAEIHAVPGREYTPELFGQTNMDDLENPSIEPVGEGITSAKEIFERISIRIRPAASLPE